MSTGGWEQHERSPCTHVISDQSELHPPESGDDLGSEHVGRCPGLEGVVGRGALVAEAVGVESVGVVAEPGGVDQVAAGGGPGEGQLRAGRDGQGDERKLQARKWI